MPVTSARGLTKNTRRVSMENACYKSCVCLEINLTVQTFPFIPTSIKNRIKLRTWAPVNGLHPSERYIAHYATYKDYALLGWAVGGPELPCYASV